MVDFCLGKVSVNHSPENGWMESVAVHILTALTAEQIKIYQTNCHDSDPILTSEKGPKENNYWFKRLTNISTQKSKVQPFPVNLKKKKGGGARHPPC